ncbi:MAG: phosphopantothenoylcysteine decarboxylase [Candidatus Omnitrophota bacterium]
MKNYRGKRILITAGPTWTAIDKVRVISNTASGETGKLLAQALTGLGAKVTLLSGPFSFDYLRSSLTKELRSKKYAIVIHSAAVSDYRPAKVFNGKLESGRESLTLKLVQAPKIINSIKKISPGSLLVGFKFEPEASKTKLIKEAKFLLNKAKADFVVANTKNNNKYRAFIISRSETLGPFLSKSALVNSLIHTLL